MSKGEILLDWVVVLAQYLCFGVFCGRTFSTIGYCLKENILELIANSSLWAYPSTNFVQVPPPIPRLLARKMGQKRCMAGGGKERERATCINSLKLLTDEKNAGNFIQQA